MATTAITSALYLLSVILLWQFRRPTIYFTLAAGLGVLAHFLLLFFQLHIIEQLNIMNVLSLICWLMIIVARLLLWLKKDTTAFVTTGLIASICIWGSALLPQQKALAAHHWAMSLHIVFSIIAYVALSFAALYSLLFYVQDARLKRGVDIDKIRMPLVDIERTLVQFALLGFLTLSLSLLTGSLFIDNLLAQHLWHKTVLSALAWVAIALLLWRYFYAGLSGKTMAIWLFLGFLTLLLGYFGSNVILQLVLNA